VTCVLCVFCKAFVYNGDIETWNQIQGVFHLSEG